MEFWQKMIIAGCTEDSSPEERKRERERRRYATLSDISKQDKICRDSMARKRRNMHTQGGVLFLITISHY